MLTGYNNSSMKMKVGTDENSSARTENQRPESMLKLLEQDVSKVGNIILKDNLVVSSWKDHYWSNSVQKHEGI